jgi:N-acetylglucosamine kinase-like BadF-type ATPase
VGDLGGFFPSALRARGWRNVAALVVGSRGIWTAAERRAVARRLARVARRVEVLSDAQIAHLGALGGGPGVLILAGTGSIVIGRNPAGRWTRAGGFGPLLGDEGSGFWLGRAWLRATTQGEDFMPARRLIQSRDPVRGIAALAPSVIARARRGDRRARTIVAEAQRHLAAQAVDVVRRLALRSPVTVSWAGSVLNDAWYRAGVARALTRAGVRARWQAPAMPPVEAAAQRAVEIARRKP